MNFRVVRVRPIVRVWVRFRVGVRAREVIFLILRNSSLCQQTKRKQRFKQLQLSRILKQLSKVQDEIAKS